MNMNALKKSFLIFCTLWCMIYQGYAQNFPVQISPIGSRPYPNNLSAFAASTSFTNPLQLRLLLTDITTGNERPINLRIKIQGRGINIVSNPAFIQNQQIILEPGIPLSLGAVDLAPYFEFQNLIGISLDQYQTALQDGSYDFCFEVIDARSSVQISDTKCVNLPVTRIQPPFLTWPLNESKIIAKDPAPQINFNWSPASGGNVTGVKYKFRLVEIPEGTRDIQGFMLATQGGNTCDQNNDNYSIVCRDNIIGTNVPYNWLANPQDNPLVEDHTYAWQVQAYIEQNGEQISSFFENFGLSQVYWFRYQTPCYAPRNIQTKQIGARSATIDWNLESAHIDYVINYREKTQDSRWYPLSTPRNFITLSNLKPDTRYEYRIAGNCDIDNTANSQILEFKTVSEDVAIYQGCGIEPDPYTLDPNAKNLDRIYPGFVIIAGDFPITVTKVEKNNSPFKGYGYAGIPWLGLPVVAVEFEGITVNSKLQLTSGIITTTYDATFSNFPGFDDPNDPDDPDDNPDQDVTLDVNGVIDNVVTNTNLGTITIYDADGQIIDIVPMPDGDNTVTLIDEDGNEWVVDAEGNVQSPADPDGGTDEDTPDIITDNLTAENIQVNFLPSGTYAFDQIPNRQVSNLLNNSTNAYKVIKEADSVTNYYIPHKVVKVNGQDKINASIRVKNNAPLSGLVFKDKNDVKLDATFNSDSTLVTLSLNGSGGFQKETIKALVSNKGKEKLAGLFTLWHLPELTSPINITLVPFNTANRPSKVTIQQELSSIFNPAMVNINVSVADPLFSTDGLYREKLKIWDPNQNDQKYSYEIRKYYIGELLKDRLIEKDHYYIFISDETPDQEVTGAMLTNNQFGFIFEKQIDNTNAAGNKNSLEQTIAYHIGKGIFGLKNATAFGADKGSTNWLTDTGNTGTKLPHMHWDKMHNDFTPYDFPDPNQDAIFDLLEEEQFKSLNFGKNGNDTFTFLSPALEGIILPPTVGKLEFFYGYQGKASQGDFKQFMDFIPGTLKGFSIGNQDFTADIVRSGNEWVLKGYKSGDEYYTYEKYNIEREGYEKSPIVLLNNKITKLYPREIEVFPFAYTSRNLKTVFDFKANILAHGSVYKEITPDNRAVIQNNISPVTREAYLWAFENKFHIQGHIFTYHKIAELRTAFPHILDDNIRNESTYNKWHTIEKSCEEKFGIRGRVPSRFVYHLLQNYCDCDIPITGPNIIGPTSCKDKVNPVNPKPKTEHEYIIEFLTFIRDDIEQILGEEVQDIFAALNKSDACDYIDNIEYQTLTTALNAGTTKDLEGLNAEVVLCILSKYANRLNINEGGSFRSGEELAVIRTLENVLPKNSKEIILGLENNNVYNPDKILYKQLFDKVDDKILSFFKDNREQLINAMVKLSLQDVTFYFERMEQFFDDLLNRNFVQEYKNVVRRIVGGVLELHELRTELLTQSEGFFREDIGYFDIDTDYDNETGLFSATQQMKEGLFNLYTDDKFTAKNLKPFDLVMFTNNTNITFLNKSNASISDFPLPAIVLLYADRKTTNRTIEQSISTTVDVVSLASGIAALPKAAKITKYLTALSMSADVASLANTGLSDEVDNPYANRLAAYSTLASLLELSFKGVKKIKDLKNQEDIDFPKASGVTSDINRMAEESPELLQTVIYNDRANSYIHYYLQRAHLEAEKARKAELVRNIVKALERVKQSRLIELGLPAGKVLKGQARIKHFEDVTSIAGEFKAFVIKEDGVITRIKRAGHFWRKHSQNRQNIAQYVSKDGLYYVKHDRETGELLFFDTTTKEPISWAKDRSEDKLFEKLLNKYAHLNDTEKEIAAYEDLIENLKRANGFTNKNTIYLPNGNISLSLDKANVILGKWEPNKTPGVSGEIGTDDILEHLTIFKNYSFADESQALRKGSILMLNLPDEVIDYNTFFRDYNLPFLDFIKKNKEKVRIVLASDPRKENLLWISKDRVSEDELTGFGKEIKYLIDNNIKEVYLKDGSIINLANLASLANLANPARRFTRTELAQLKRADLPDFVANNLDDLLLAENRTVIWRLKDVFTRGDLIEEIFNQWDKKYKNYQNLNDINPNYKTLDFDGAPANFNEVVSLKTFKPISDNSLSNFKKVLRNNVRKLNNDAKIEENHSGKDRVLDLAIEKGFWTNKQLNDIKTFINNDLRDEFPNVARIRISEF